METSSTSLSSKIVIYIHHRTDKVLILSNRLHIHISDRGIGFGIFYGDVI